jgi:hypothetical protein
MARPSRIVRAGDPAAARRPRPPRACGRRARGVGRPLRLSSLLVRPSPCLSLSPLSQSQHTRSSPSPGPVHGWTCLSHSRRRSPMSAAPALDPRQAFPHLFPPAASTISSQPSLIQSSGLPSTNALDGQPALPRQPSASHPTAPLPPPPDGSPAAAMSPPDDPPPSKAGTMVPAPPGSPVDQVRLPPTKAAELARFEVLETLGTSLLLSVGSSPVPPSCGGSLD